MSKVEVMSDEQVVEQIMRDIEDVLEDEILDESADNETDEEDDCEEDNILEEKDESDYEYITKVGHCIYCNQSKMVEVFEGDLLDVSSVSGYINLCVTKECECEMAREERSKKHRIERGQESVKEFFKAKYPEAAKMLCDAVELIVEGKIKKITIDTGNCEKAIVECNSAGKIKVQSKVSKNKAAEV